MGSWAQGALPLLAPALLLALALAALAFRWSGRQRRRLGLPRGRIVASDMGGWERPRAPLYSERHRLTGKPDYVVRQGRALVPVEVKPGRQVAEPYESDIMQLAAYCLLLEEAEGQAPPHGLIRYRDRTFRVPYTPALRRALLDLLGEMRAQAAVPDVAPNHADPQRCARCGQRDHCGWRWR